MLIGGGDAHNPLRWDYQIYVPWYIADGDVRPSIEAINGIAWTPTTPAVSVPYGQSFTIRFNADVGVPVNKVVLMRPSSVTHGCNDEQRHIELEVEESSETPNEIIAKMPAKAPSDPTMLPGDVSGPPGFYMVHVVSTSRVPSEAAWVHLIQ